ncbi:AAA family ATPase [Chryseobacterium sp. LC2016-29]|uniref:AAA family ATPase n=1 Tax=Chryseobacterium sp. LC2016-29 TaxID=2897331 RepID=UPI001E28C20C|nr:AAA family ATPase [Chryseobacterium sp. LC2016-29]MCD0480377.1 AAA family ATPase [Chryseobacterium sp. LC2016-29]
MTKNIKILTGSAGSGKTEYVKHSLEQSSDSNFSVYSALNSYNTFKRRKFTRERIKVTECSTFIREKKTEEIIESLKKDILENKTIVIDEAYWIFSGNRYNLLEDLLKTESLKILFIFQSSDQIKLTAPFLIKNDYEILNYNSSIERIKSNWALDEFFNT